MTHTKARLPEYFAIETCTRDQYTAVINCLLSLGWTKSRSLWELPSVGYVVGIDPTSGEIDNNYGDLWRHKQAPIYSYEAFMKLIEVKTLPEHYAVRAENNDQYQALLQWFKAEGFKVSVTCSATYDEAFPSIGVVPIGTNNSVSGGKINDFNDWAPVDSRVKIISYSEFRSIVADTPKIGGDVPAKRIIGYNLLKDYPNMPDPLKKERQLVVTAWGKRGEPQSVAVKNATEPSERAFGAFWPSEFPEFFEPIYKKEFKIGDWVTFTTTAPKAFTMKLTSIRGDTLHGIGLGRKGVCNDTSARIATPEEIAASEPTTLTLGLHRPRKFVIRKDVIAVYKCNDTLIQIQPSELFRLMKNFTIEGFTGLITGIQIEGTILEYHMLEKIWKAYVEHTLDWYDKLQSNK